MEIEIESMEIEKRREREKTLTFERSPRKLTLGLVMKVGTRSVTPINHEHQTALGLVSNYKLDTDVS